MSRYRGPRLKIIRRLKTKMLPGLTTRIIFRKDKEKKKDKNKYRIRLHEKQKLRFNYGLTERQLLKYARIAAKAKGPTGQVLLQLLEMRLDNILFRLGMARTIPGARQLVNHRHILVNGRLVDIPSYRCKPRDTITAKDKKKSKALIQKSFDSFVKDTEALSHLSQKSRTAKDKKKSKALSKKVVDFFFQKELIVPPHLTLKQAEYTGLVNQIVDGRDVGLKIKELLVVEYYSRQTKT